MNPERQRTTHSGPGDTELPEDEDYRRARRQAEREECQEREIDRLHYGWREP